MLKLIHLHSQPLAAWRPASTLLRPLASRPHLATRPFGTSLIRFNQKAASDTPTKAAGDGKVVVDISEHPIIKRLPKFLHPYTVRFLNAPVSHVTSFIILHEFTAIAPLFGLWSLFSYLDYTPLGVPDFLLDKGTEFINVLADRNGWTDLKTEGGAKMVLQGAAAYAIVKILMPARAMLSLALMPWFAKWFVIPFTRIFSRGQKSKVSAAAKEAVPRPTPADPKGQVWNQDLPPEPPQFQPKKSDFNRPSL